MLKIRVIPTLLLKNYGLVKGIGFDSWRRVGTVLPAINVYNSRNVDELILVDIEATNQKKEFSIDSVNDVADNCFVPLSLGGGINNISSATKLIENGCDKVTINSAIYSNPKLITQLANLFGSQAVVASIDAYYEKNKDDHIQKVKEYQKRTNYTSKYIVSPEKKKEYARRAYLKKKEKIQKEIEDKNESDNI